MTLEKDLAAALKSVGKEWKTAKADSGRKQRVGRQRMGRMRYPSMRVTIRDAAFAAIPEAYRRASSDGTYAANARQIYYAARPEILEATGRNELNSQYFCQSILKSYIEEHPGALPRLVYDDRGHITEPHTNEVVGLGGTAVANYIADFSNGKVPQDTSEWMPEIRIGTKGPSLRYGGVLFIEKEGFDEILRESGLLDRYDLALASTKGMPVSALCDLLRTLSHSCQVFALHDFDKAGFSMLYSLEYGTRGSHGGVQFQDLGLRMEDIEGLPSEPVDCGPDARWNLYRNGATKEEVEFLTDGQRVELNAMESEAFLEFVERKLQEAGAHKVIPDDDALRDAYQRAARRSVVAKAIESAETKETPAPDGLADKVRSLLEDEPELTWDEAVNQVFEDEQETT